MKTIVFEESKAGSQSTGGSEALAILAARAGCRLEKSMERFTLADDQNLGHFEMQAAHDVQELLRQATERAAQAKADQTPPRCPVCGQAAEPALLRPPAQL